MSRFVTLGETMGLIRSDRIGPLNNNSAMIAGIGGAESNAAIALSRLGNDVSWVGRVGSDDFCRLIERELTAEGITTFGLRGRGPTGLMIKTTPFNGRQDVSYARTLSAGSELNTGDISAPDIVAAIEQAEVLHLTGITLAISGSSREAALKAVEIARASGTAVSFDVNHRSKLWSADKAHAAYNELARKVDIVFAGFDEVRLLLDADSPVDPLDMKSSLDRISELGVRTPVIKEGTLGAWSLDGENVIHAPAITVDAVDTVGAGDGFAAGFLDAIARGQAISAALSRGAEVGAFACLTPGDWEGYPRSSQLGLLTGSSETVDR